MLIVKCAVPIKKAFLRLWKLAGIIKVRAMLRPFVSGKVSANKPVKPVSALAVSEFMFILDSAFMFASRKRRCQHRNPWPLNSTWCWGDLKHRWVLLVSAANKATYIDRKMFPREEIKLRRYGSLSPSTDMYQLSRHVIVQLWQQQQWGIKPIEWLLTAAS